MHALCNIPLYHCSRQCFLFFYSLIHVSYVKEGVPILLYFIILFFNLCLTMRGSLISWEMGTMGIRVPILNIGGPHSHMTPDIPIRDANAAANPLWLQRKYLSS